LASEIFALTDASGISLCYVFRPMSRLAEIVAHKQEEITPWVKHTAEWHDRAVALGPLRGFRRRLTAAKFAFIGEVKKASPSAGVITSEFDPVQTALVYDHAGANCISVLTDERYFQGHLDYLALIRRKVSRPLLRKDFTVHEVQIYQAALAGADAVLLIVAALTDDELKRFKSAAEQIRIDCLIEVHDEIELDRALDAGADFIGINNRNLATFVTDLQATEFLAPKIPEGCTIVSESGIRTADDVRRVVRAGAHAALIGESLMRAPDAGALLESFVTAASEAN
jgi:indole-3-glycerol phosphate synthase